jgi:hypothetical protein
MLTLTFVKYVKYPVRNQFFSDSRATLCQMVKITAGFRTYLTIRSDKMPGKCFTYEK